ncbi:MAG: hypothetical protein LUJ09_07280 [Firmicutes bacterium]|nr:hypothetical protein [Bacillota bacterium]
MTTHSQRKGRIFRIFPLLLLFFLSGCGAPAQAEPAPFRVITEIHIIRGEGTGAALYTCTDGEIMRQVLTYLRGIDPYGTPEVDPASVPGADYRVVLTYSDGCEQIFHQRCNRYMQVDGGAWKKIDPEKADQLEQLVEAITR